MKKLVLLFVCLLPVLVACEGDEGPMGPMGEGMNWDVERMTIRPTDWERVEADGEVYYRCVRVPQIFREFGVGDREFIYHNGTVLAFMYENFGTDEETQRPLPYVINWNNSNDESQVITYYFDYTPDDVAFYFSYSGDEGEYRPSVDIVFRIVMNW